MAAESKHLLSLMGLPWVQAPSEGEAQAAHLTKVGDSDFCASQDYDSLLFGAQKAHQKRDYLRKKKIAEQKHLHRCHSRARRAAKNASATGVDS